MATPMRKFTEWFSGFRESISDYRYYVDFEKVHQNIDKIKVELNILNSLIGSDNIEADFQDLYQRYPEILKCVPLLLAVRADEIYCQDENGGFLHNFDLEKDPATSYNHEQTVYFLKKTGLFDLLENHIISNLIDYATGVETGLDSNGRKNRGGHLMENLVESYLVKAGLRQGDTYFKEIRTTEIEKKWGVNLSELSNGGKTVKRFDFVVKKSDIIYGVETNFYSSGGSKLNETARSYKTIALEAKQIEGFKFVWFTDGKGWNSARNNLEETFDVMEHIYNINDMESGIISRVLI